MTMQTALAEIHTIPGILEVAEISAISNYLKNNEQELFRFLRELVLQPSYTRDKSGVDAVGHIITRELASLPMTRTCIEQGEMGNHLVFQSPACTNSNLKPILLVGHMDTVFPPDSGFDSYTESGDRVMGPGVIDMKGGLVTAIFAIKALNSCSLLEHIPITLLCNSDEEVGSPTSKEHIAAVARESLLAMVFECGGLGGEVVTGRKGKTGFVLNVKGRAGHAAFSGLDKASAILELSRKIIEIEKLNNPEKQLVVNVGVVNGGIGPNTVPEHASALIDTRYLTEYDGQCCAAEITRLSNECLVPHTHATLEISSSRPSMEQSSKNSELYNHILQVADRLNILIKDELRSGVSDANVIAAAGIPVIDGLGPIGDCDHSDREYMLKHTLPERTLLAANGIFSCWREFNR